MQPATPSMRERFQKPRDRTSKLWLRALIFGAAMTATWFLMIFLLEALFATAETPSLWRGLFEHRPENLARLATSLPELAILLACTVIGSVSIIVQLSATRYTPRVAEIFFRSRTHLAILSLLVIVALNGLAIGLWVRTTVVPKIWVFSATGLLTAVLLLLIPYLAYVFAFLDPSRVVQRLKRHALERLPAKGKKVIVHQGPVLEIIEELADISLTAEAKKDRVLAARAVLALKQLTTAYLGRRLHLHPTWFEFSDVLRSNADFQALDALTLNELARGHTWLEWKILRQLHALFQETLNRSRSLADLIALATREIGETAIQLHEKASLRIVVRYFNTYLRTAVNEQDERTCFRVMHQYRLLGEKLLCSRWNDEVIDLADYLRYYGQVADSAGLPLVTEGVAFDLALLCEVAHREKFPFQEHLLHALLELNNSAEGSAGDRAFRGIRKAQVKLATYYLSQNSDEMARLIWRDIATENRERLIALRDDLLAAGEPVLWEFIDRSDNIDYLDPVRKEHLTTFFSWFTPPLNA